MRVSETEEEEECTHEKNGFLLLSMMMMICRYRWGFFKGFLSIVSCV